MKLAISAACLGFVLAAAAGAAPGPVRLPATELATELTRIAPGINPDVVTLAIESLACATRAQGGQAPRRLAVIDYSKHSAEQRLWVFDLEARKLLLVERVAHGSGSGENTTTHFSNLPGSHQSSLGLFRTSETYVGQNGYSLRLDGLEPGFNDRARERAIVIHGASYVSDAMISRRGGLGRSWGCPAVRLEIARPLIDAIKGGQYLFAYYPDTAWLRHSPLRACPLVAGR